MRDYLDTSAQCQAATVQTLPQVYVRVREGDGTLAGREVVSLTADNIANLGGEIAARESLSLE
ncbi:hypothetical protein, partial [Vreelandella olivaria]|uniref:hypothetical protein n=1 Tax=Vreelandella olivaria TaxID=390919 RepID=UPI00201F3826